MVGGAGERGFVVTRIVVSPVGRSRMRVWGWVQEVVYVSDRLVVVVVVLEVFH